MCTSVHTAAMENVHKALKTSDSELLRPNFVEKTIYGNYSNHCRQLIAKKLNFHHFLALTLKKGHF